MKYAIPDFTHLLNQKIKVSLNQSRYFIGKLISTDAYGNLKMVDVIDQNSEKYKSVVLRGQAIKNILSYKT